MINTKFIAWESPMIQIKTQEVESLPLFKGEKKPSEFQITSEFCRRVSQQVFSKYAEFLGKQVDRDIEINPKMSATIFSIIGKAVGKSAKEVQSEIRKYAAANKGTVLMNLRNLANEVGLSLESISVDEMIRLIGSSHPENLGKKGLAKYVGKKKAITPKHLANHAIAQIVADLYKTNVTVREMQINYDRMFTSGMALETMRFEVSAEGNTRSIELIQGWGMFTNGIFSAKYKLLTEHFPPVSIVSSEEKT